ncbi:MAG TPA: hypothetical protein VGH27_03620 [Streptosporangiaceae bacterium]|jgi:hypothetical protein
MTAFAWAAGSPALAGQVHAATAGSAARAATADTTAAGGAVKVLLPTGDVVLLSGAPGGRQTASVIKAQKSGPGTVFQMFNEGKDLYVVPQSAVPYLGSTMSPSLFDVTQLAQQEQGNLSLAVRLTLRTTAGRAALPGVTITHHAGLAATGRLTVTSARAFGTALARQAGRDHASATHTTGLFAGVTRIAPAQAAAQAPARASTHHVRPDYQMYTLTLNGIDSAGKKDNGDSVLVYNVDNLLKYSGEAVFSNGQAKISVPEGQYSAICQFYNFETGAVSAVTIGQFTVSGDTSQTVDARTATSAVSVSTPRPATPAVFEVAIGRADKLGQTGSNSFLGDAQTSFTVTPVTSGITAGQLYYYVYSRAFSPASAKSPYTYDAEFPDTGAIPVNQAYVAQASDLATVTSSYPAMRPNTSALDTRFGALPWQTFLFASDVNFTTPLQRTEYYTVQPDLSWEGVYYGVFSASPFELLGSLDSSWTTYQAGTTSSTVWGGQPQLPRLLEGPIYVNQVICPACLNGDTLNLIAFPFSDNDPAHRGYPDGKTRGLTESESYQVSADGVPVSHGTGFFQDKVTLPAGSKDVSISYDTTRSSSTMTQSTSTATTWTVRTGAPQGALPGDWYCDTDLHTTCGVLPLMFANYDLPVNLLGRLAPGSVTAGIDVSHLAGASDVAVKSLTVQVSFNGGTSWQKATATAQGNGQYSVSFTVPAAASTDGFGALKLSATDAYDGTLSQTIQHAFAVAAS